MKPFNIAQVLADAGVNNDTSARKQIEYIPIGQIEADPGNFYDLPKLEELANSISIIGLQEPVVVRPVEDGRYRIISGHRRTAALRILIDRGEHDDKVMCIVERQQESEALTQLKLIMGNSENRVLTSAEQARQVEETQQLIYQLKQEGFDFPGRVRDYVSDICKISTGKIARLQVIRSQLVPGFLNLWEAGKLKDSVAYALAKQPPVRQNAVKHCQMDVPGRDEFPCSKEWLENIFSAMDKVESDCNDYGITISGTGLNQYHNVGSFDTNKIYTVAACDSNDNVKLASGVLSAGIWSDYIVFVIDGNNNPRIVLTPGSYKWAAIYEGEYTAETLPEYQPKGYGAELAECQRYYQAFRNNAFLGTVVVDIDGVNFQGSIPCGEMRVGAPTIIGSIAAWDGLAATAVSSVTAFKSQGNGMRINGSLSRNVTQGKFLILYAATEVAFSADL